MLICNFQFLKNKHLPKEENKLIESRKIIFSEYLKIIRLWKK